VCAFFGIVILVVGAILFGFGLQIANSTVEKVPYGLTGKYTDETLWYIIGGVLMIIAGSLLALFWKKKF
jgi:LPXTG-motif cell wall-anchored protein